LCRKRHEGTRRPPRFRREAKFSTWLIQITINEARLKRRKDRRHLYDSIDEQQTDDQGDAFPKDLPIGGDPFRGIAEEGVAGGSETRTRFAFSEIS